MHVKFFCDFSQSRDFYVFLVLLFGYLNFCVLTLFVHKKMTWFEVWTLMLTYLTTNVNFLGGWA